MITDLEKQFFDTFGIEPQTGIGLVKFQEPHYPTITDRHYLELIAMLGYFEFSNLGDNKTLKEFILEQYINFDWHAHLEMKPQVQKLFKGEK